jgi:hypothetical protein
LCQCLTGKQKSGAGTAPLKARRKQKVSKDNDGTIKRRDHESSRHKTLHIENYLDAI